MPAVDQYPQHLELVVVRQHPKAAGAHRDDRDRVRVVGVGLAVVPCLSLTTRSLRRDSGMRAVLFSLPARRGLPQPSQSNGSTLAWACRINTGEPSGSVTCCAVTASSGGPRHRTPDAHTPTTAIPTPPPRGSGRLRSRRRQRGATSPPPARHGPRADRPRGVFGLDLLQRRSMGRWRSTGWGFNQPTWPHAGSGSCEG